MRWYLKLKREQHTGLQTLNVLMKPYETFAGRAVSIYVLFQLCKPYKNSNICNHEIFFFFYSLCWLIQASTRLIISKCFFTAFFSVWIIPVFSWCYGIFFCLSICRWRSWVVWLYMTRRGNSGFLNNVCYLNLCNFIVFFYSSCVWVGVCLCMHAFCRLFSTAM